MKLSKLSIVAFLSIANDNFTCHAFTLPQPQFALRVNHPSTFSINKQIPSSTTQLKEQPTDDQDNEIAKLRSMAAQLRAEASKLEAEKAESLALAAQKAFQQFDTNNDGEISVSELKAGLEKAFKVSYIPVLFFQFQPFSPSLSFSTFIGVFEQDGIVTSTCRTTNGGIRCIR